MNLDNYILYIEKRFHNFLLRVNVPERRKMQEMGQFKNEIAEIIAETYELSSEKADKMVM